MLFFTTLVACATLSADSSPNAKRPRLHSEQNVGNEPSDEANRIKCAHLGPFKGEIENGYEKSSKLVASNDNLSVQWEFDIHGWVQIVVVDTENLHRNSGIREMTWIEWPTRKILFSGNVNNSVDRKWKGTEMTEAKQILQKHGVGKSTQILLWSYQNDVKNMGLKHDRIVDMQRLFRITLKHDYALFDMERYPSFESVYKIISNSSNYIQQHTSKQDAMDFADLLSRATISFNLFENTPSLMQEIFKLNNDYQKSIELHDESKAKKIWLKIQSRVTCPHYDPLMAQQLLEYPNYLIPNDQFAAPPQYIRQSPSLEQHDDGVSTKPKKVKSDTKPKKVKSDNYCNRIEDRTKRKICKGLIDNLNKWPNDLKKTYEQVLLEDDECYNAWQSADEEMIVWAWKVMNNASKNNGRTDAMAVLKQHVPVSNLENALPEILNEGVGKIVDRMDVVSVLKRMSVDVLVAQKEKIMKMVEGKNISWEDLVGNGAENRKRILL